MTANDAPRDPNDLGGGPTGPRSGLKVVGKYFARRGRRERLRGVTYGPFAPDRDGAPFPSRARVRGDLDRMRAAAINAVRLYHVAPAWLLAEAEERGVGVLVDVPWPKHLCFLGSARAEASARRAVRRAAARGRRQGGCLAYSIGNEIPADIVRWHGARRVERFLGELCDVAKQVDPECLVTYANYPPTEYLELAALDFVTFNVYLHDPIAFRNYLFRLQNLAGDRPLVLGELGMDSLRHGEAEQAGFLAGQLREAVLTGLAGAFVFSWTDDWHTGGSPIEDWAFGITTADRVPKRSFATVSDVFRTSLSALLPSSPRVSVIVCTYNGAATLPECLDSLALLDYPDYEVIVVDDGSSDETRAILGRYPGVHAIHQPNLGLGVARNVGLAAATGSIIAYTDSDCAVDPDWLSLLVYQLERSEASGVGGPNLSPEDGRRPACVAAAPGQPTHVLESDQVAEHIPGCNMAFRREALEAIRGFDPRFRKAGDDVDLCWRLQHEGFSLTFAPGAFVWHHRRPGLRAYLKQQAGYGAAEALLQFKHPDKFTDFGRGKWRGVVYGASLQGLRLSGPIIYRGTFGTGPFQSLYQPGPAHWALLPSTLEWQAAALVLAPAGLVLGPAGWLPSASMFALSVMVAGLQASQARLAPAHRGWGARLLIAALCFTQPLCRSWSRYWTRLLAHRAPRPDPGLSARRPSWLGRGAASYWSESGPGRTDLLREAVEEMNGRGWGKALDSGWCSWDLEVYCHAGLLLEVCTVQEDHGGGRRLIRVRHRLHATTWARILVAAGVAAVGFAAPLSAWAAGVFALGLLGVVARAWRGGLASASQVLGLFDHLAGRLGMVPCPSEDVVGPRVRGKGEDVAASGGPGATTSATAEVPAAGGVA